MLASIQRLASGAKSPRRVMVLRRTSLHFSFVLVPRLRYILCAAPSARTGACAAAVDGRLFVFGGMDMEQGFLDDFYTFDVGMFILTCLLNSFLRLTARHNTIASIRPITTAKATSTWEKVQSVGREGPTPRDKSALCAVGKYVCLRNRDLTLKDSRPVPLFLKETLSLRWLRASNHWFRRRGRR